jgi:hypothetical protein
VDTQDVFEIPLFSIFSTDKHFLLLCLQLIIRLLSYRFFRLFPLIFKSPSSFSYAHAICNPIFSSELRSSGLLRGG